MNFYFQDRLFFPHLLCFLSFSIALLHKRHDVFSETLYIDNALTQSRQFLFQFLLSNSSSFSSCHSVLDELSVYTLFTYYWCYPAQQKAPNELRLLLLWCTIFKSGISISRSRKGLLRCRTVRESALELFADGSAKEALEKKALLDGTLREIRRRLLVVCLGDAV